MEVVCLSAYGCIVFRWYSLSLGTYSVFLLLFLSSVSPRSFLSLSLSPILARSLFDFQSPSLYVTSRHHSSQGVARRAVPMPFRPPAVIQSTQQCFRRVTVSLSVLVTFHVEIASLAAAATIRLPSKILRSSSDRSFSKTCTRAIFTSCARQTSNNGGGRSSRS